MLETPAGQSPRFRQVEGFSALSMAGGFLARPAGCWKGGKAAPESPFPQRPRAFTPPAGRLPKSQRKRASSRMPVLSLSEVDIPADRIGIPPMRNPPPARVLPDEPRFLAVEIIAVVAHTAPPGKLPSAANQVERFRWQHTPAPRTALLCWQHPFPKPPPRHPSAHGQAIPLEAVSSLFSRRARRAARTRHTTTLRQSRQSTNRVRPLRKGSHRT